MVRHRAGSVPLILVALLAAAAPSVGAQGGGFVAGDLYVYSAAAQDLSSTGGAILRCNPVTGATSLFVDLFTTQQAPGAAVFDPHRQRVVFSGGITSISEPIKLWFADGAGAVQDSGLGNRTFHSMAPTGDGRIYLRDALGGGSPLKWIDAAGALHTLLDAAGAAPFLIDGNSGYSVRGMLYDAGTNALFVASNQACAGGTAGRVYVLKLPLSADGARVAGPVSCADFDVSSSGETPAGWSRLPGGLLLLGVDTNSNAQEPRLLSVDPVTLAIAGFASNGSYIGAAASNAACWSSGLGKAVILDTFSNTLRAFSMGETGAGTLIATSLPLSENGGSGETPAMFEIAASACSGGWLAYGAGLAGAGGVLPALSGGGCPEPGAPISLHIAGVVGGASGALFVNLAPGALPFKGGTLHLADVLLTVNLAVGGAPGAAGAGALTLPAALPANPVLSGLSVFLQCAFSDTAAIQKVSLTNGLRLDIG